LDCLEIENWEDRNQIANDNGLRRRGAQFWGHIVLCIVGTQASFCTREYPVPGILWSTLSGLPRRPPSAASCPFIRYFSVVLALPPCVVLAEGISFVIVRPSY
jgi:hypothetical protein